TYSMSPIFGSRERAVGGSNAKSSSMSWSSFGITYFKDHGLPQYAEEISPKGRKHCPCGKELIDINSRGEILSGCSRCNVWWQPNKPPVRLSEEDLLALHTRGAERLQKGPEAEPSGDYEY